MQKRINIIAFFAITLFTNLLFSQIQPNGSMEAMETRLFCLPSIDNTTLLENENSRRASKLRPNFAHAFDVDISPQSAGVWSTNSDGSLIWELDILSEQAYSLNLGFSEFILAGNADLSIFDLRNNTLLGSFSAHQNDLHKQLFTPIFETDYLRLRLSLAPKYKTQSRLRLSKINHAFMPLHQKSLTEDCHLDVTCGVDDGLAIVDVYRNAIHSVGLITIDGIGICSGVLLNNTANDFRPYFMTAEHCGIKSSNAATVVVYWNYQNSTCRSLFSVENTLEGDGSFQVYNTGASLKSFYNPSDMTLLELDDPVPNGQGKIFFAGWDRTDIPPTQAACVHHPNGEEKRISIDYHHISKSNHFSEPTTEGNHWRVEAWDLGSTEIGSSGGALFNTNNQVIGQLHGGDATCQDSGSDWFGAFSNSWEGAGFSQGQLSHWLDAQQTGQEKLEGLLLDIINPLSLGLNILQQVSCFGGNDAIVELSIFGGQAPFQYSKDGITYVDSPIFDSLEIGEYIFFVKDAMGTISSSSPLLIKSPDLLEISTVIIGSDFMLTCIGGVEPYEYSLDGINFQESNIFELIQQGPQSVYVKDANACEQMTTINLEWDILGASFIVLEEIECHGDSTGAFELVISGGIAPYGVFLEDIFQTNLTFTNQSARSYSFLIVDSTLDTLYYNFALSEPSPLSLEIEVVQNILFITGTGGTGNYTYSLDNEMYQKDNLFENLENGFYEVFIQDENNCKTSDTLSIYWVSTNSVEQINLQIYPNPTQSQLTIEIGHWINDIERIEIYDMEGHLAWKLDYPSQAKINIPITDWTNGIYLVHIQGHRLFGNQKIIKN